MVLFTKLGMILRASVKTNFRFLSEETLLIIKILKGHLKLINVTKISDSISNLIFSIYTQIFESPYFVDFIIFYHPTKTHGLKQISHYSIALMVKEEIIKRLGSNFQSSKINLSVISAIHEFKF